MVYATLRKGVWGIVDMFFTFYTVEVRQITGTATSLIGNYPYKTIMKHDFNSVT